jgi:hypothetical protein
MKYKISPQCNNSGNVIIELTGNTSEGLVEILFSLPPQDHEGFNFTPQKAKSSVWATEFASKQLFTDSLNKYRSSWSDVVNTKLDLFMTDLDENLQEFIETKAVRQSGVKPSVKTNSEVEFKNIFPARANPQYSCPKCRVEKGNWLSPYNVGTLASNSLDLCSDVQSLITDETCFFCRSNVAISGYQDELHTYLISVFKCNFFNSKIYDLLGAKTVHATFDIELGKVNTLKFELLGIGSDIEILDLNLTSQGGASLTELHGNSPILGRQDYSNLEASYYPTQLFDNPSSENNSCSLMLTYLDKYIKAHHENFFQMLRAFIRRDSNAFILRGSACIEQLLYQICASELSHVPGKASKGDVVKSVLTNSLSYSPQLQYLFPLICKANKLAPLTEKLIANLLTIKKRRDVIAHKGRLEDKNNNPISLFEKEFFDYAATFSSVYGLLLQLHRTINT